jgi:hypothetical protein
MRRLLLIAALLLPLAACGGSTAPVLTLADACNSFANALDQLTPLKASGKLSPSTVGAVDNAIALTTPLCSPGVAPTDVASAVSLVAGEAQAILAIVAKGS